MNIRLLEPTESIREVDTVEVYDVNPGELFIEPDNLSLKDGDLITGIDIEYVRMRLGSTKLTTIGMVLVAGLYNGDVLQMKNNTKVYVLNGRIDIENRLV